MAKKNNETIESFTSAVADLTIRHKVARLLVDEMSLPDLRVWAFDRVAKGGDEELLLADLERACAAFYDGRTDEDGLRSALLGIVLTARVGKGENENVN